MKPFRLRVCLMLAAVTLTQVGAWSGPVDELMEAGFVSASGTSLWGRSSGTGWQVHVQRSLLPRLDIAARITPQSPFALEARALIVKDLLPLQVSTSVGPGYVSLHAAVLLGPVHIDYGRTWGLDNQLWGAVTLSANARMALFAGWEIRTGPLAGVRIFPSGTALWEVTLIFCDGRVGVGIGGRR